MTMPMSFTSELLTSGDSLRMSAWLFPAARWKERPKKRNILPEHAAGLSEVRPDASWVDMFEENWPCKCHIERFMLGDMES
jgi:hypothetical protein